MPNVVLRYAGIKKIENGFTVVWDESPVKIEDSVPEKDGCCSGSCESSKEMFFATLEEAAAFIVTIEK